MLHSINLGLPTRFVNFYLAEPSCALKSIYTKQGVYKQVHFRQFVLVLFQKLDRIV